MYVGISRARYSAAAAAAAAATSLSISSKMISSSDTKWHGTLTKRPINESRRKLPQEFGNKTHHCIAK
jgi:hypothetical protein